MTSRPSDESATPFVNDPDPASYTSLRLQHAAVEHLHLTTRRCFVGPIPEGWLKSHRKSWYSRYLSLSDYSSRSVKFSASPYLSHHWQTTGLDGPSASATFGHSFPQPEDIDGEPDDEPDLSKSRQDGTENAGPEDVADELEAPSTAVEIGDGSPEAGSPRKEPPGRSKWRPTSKDRFDAGNSKDRPNNSCFGTAPMKQRKNSKSKLSPLLSAKSPPASSFVTAKEIQTPRKNIQEAVKTDSGGAPRSMNTAQLQPGGNPESPISAMSRQPNNGDPMSQQISASSTEALLPHGPSNAGNGRSPELQPGDSAPVFDGKAAQTPEATRDGMVRFNLDNAHRSDTPATVRFALPGRRRSWRHLRKESSHPGEIVKMEKMLVRVDSTVQELPADYDENEGFKIETRAVEKWREFVIVCRESTTEDADFSIQMYKTRVIPAKEQTHVQKRSAHEIPLARKKTHVNLYSSLDKTLVIWVPWKLGTMMYILRTHSAASAVEWYTFIRSTLGSHRTTSLQISVPDLSVTLQLENPFGELEASMSRAQAAKGDEEAISKTMEAERAVASTIIQRSLKMLENNPEWSNVLEAWLAKEKVGLAWKRYDRLEWIHGSNEQRMYGTLAMQRTHELELRPKEHYPTSIKQKDHKLIEEPAPVEGFLVRLTSQKGRVKRLGQMYFKRLYFATHNQFLCYCRPAKALPPSPPELRLSETAKVPKASDIVDQIPLIYAVNPYPEKEGEIEWLHQGTAASIARHDEGAYKEAERKINTILQAEGYINLSHILRVQNAQRGSSLADENVGYGPDVDFHEEVEDIRQEDGKTEQFDDNRTFELVMKNKLIIRLQAYNESAKKEWIHRLRKLINYWKLRLAADMDLLKAIRALNLKRLELDEESEAYIGQFGSKWEVTRSVASPKLFNMCGISCCRTITMSGTLYRKPKRHSTFQRCGVILCHGQMLIFHGTIRERTGKEVPHIQHDRQDTIDLKDCYIYSGLVTERDLLYRNQTFDSNHPGHHALPRVYLEDGWTSTDEDTMTCFVIWQPRSKSLFKAKEEQDSGKTKQRLRYVSALGTPGRSVVFKTRSRAERDHWVMSIGMEIDRLQVGDDIRIVDRK